MYLESVELAKPLHNVTPMKLFVRPPFSRAKAVWGPKRIVVSAALLAVSLCLASDASAQGRHSRQAPKLRPGTPDTFVRRDKMDAEVSKRAYGLNRFANADVIVTLEDGVDLPLAFQRFSHNGKLSVVHGYVLDQVPVSLLDTLASDTSIHRVHINRPAHKHDALSSVAVNANAVDLGNGINNPSLYAYTGAGVTVAFIDSGITSYQHPDLADSRVLAFVDFVNQRTVKYDDNGHGTHIAGIIGGSGKLSAKKYAGMAPGASLVSLKVLDQNGEGSIGNILKALDWVYINGKAYGVRVVNLSVGAAVTESYYTDPLTLAARTLVDSGITVVAAAGNGGQNALGRPQWGGVVSPANAPWVLTVCAFSTKGTYSVADDSVAPFSSAGPTAIDFSAKPDLCAPGVGVVSTAGPDSTLFQSGLLSSLLLPGTVVSLYPYAPYESLSGTSMATPAVSGAIALMLQANPKLTPNLIKAILEFTAISKPGVSPLRQGAGFMNVSHAVALAALAGQPGITHFTMPSSWSRHILWGNHMLSGGVLNPKANAWRLGVEWGWARTKASDGDNIVWGTAADGDNIVWGTAADGDNIVWGTDDGDNIVWGTDCGGADCDNVVWGASDGDNIVWGTAADGDNIVWGTSDGDNIVWGTAADGDNIVWGTANVANNVWPIFKGGR
jgi:serine protease AprX